VRLSIKPMADDPLAKWRRHDAQATSPAAESGGESKVVELVEYRGDTGRDRFDGWLELRPLNGPWSLCSYAQLRKIQFNGPKPTRIDLIFTYELVTVKGPNLELLLPGLRSRTLGRIEQFGLKGQEPPESDALLVESIESSDNGPGRA
jgi:hypothetical protein